MLNFPDQQAGQNVSCTSCGTILALPRSGGEQVAPGAPPAPASQGIQPPSRLPAGYDDEGYGGGRGGRDWERDDRDRDYADAPISRTAPGWRLVRAGLMIIFISSIFVLVLSVFAVIASAAMGLDMERDPFGQKLNNPNDPLGAGGGAIVAIGCAMIIAVIAAFVGLCLCIAVPRESGAKGHAIGTVVILVITVVVALGGGMIVGVQMAQGMQQGFQGGGVGQDRVANAFRLAVMLGVGVGLIGFVAAVFFALFLRAIALFFGRTMLAKHAIWVLVGYGATTVLGMVLQFLMLQLPNPMDLGPLLVPQRLLQALQLGIMVYSLIVLFMVYKAIRVSGEREGEERLA